MNETPLAEANRVHVFDGLHHLQRAFNAFLHSYHEPLSPVDLLMIAHNFHKKVIHDLERSRPLPRPALYVDIAEATWREASEEMRTKEHARRVE